ncbi:MAG: hypothetical protein MHM6MM_003733 [Cercozoa sp. M6MM]
MSSLPECIAEYLRAAQCEDLAASFLSRVSPARAAELTRHTRLHALFVRNNPSAVRSSVSRTNTNSSSTNSSNSLSSNSLSSLASFSRGSNSISLGSNSLGSNSRGSNSLGSNNLTDTGLTSLPTMQMAPTSAPSAAESPTAPECPTKRNDAILQQLLAQRPKRTPQGRFVCDFPGCGKLFTKSQNLRRHQKNAHSEQARRFPCDQCGQLFSRAADMRSHRAAHHPDGVLPLSPPGCPLPPPRVAPPRGERVSKKRRRMCTQLPPLISVSEMYQQHDAHDLPPLHANSHAHTHAHPHAHTQPCMHEHEHAHACSHEHAHAHAHAHVQDSQTSEQQAGVCPAEFGALHLQNHHHAGAAADPSVPTCGIVGTDDFACDHWMLRHDDHYDFLINGELHHCGPDGHCESHGSVQSWLDTNPLSADLSDRLSQHLQPSPPAP